MNWLDWVLCAFLLASIANGFVEGFVRMSIGLLSAVVGFVVASWFGGVVADSLMPHLHSRPLALIFGFQIVFFGILIAGVLLAWLLSRMLKIIGLSFFDRLLGGGFGIVRGFLTIVVITMVVMAFAPKSLPSAAKESRIAPYVLKSAQLLAEVTPFEIRDGFNRAYKDMRDAWKEVVRPHVKPRKLDVKIE